jgi:hypothetical protein
MPGRHNHLWTSQEDAALRDMVAQGVHPRRIAVRLRRTRSGIRGRASRLGLTFKTVPLRTNRTALRR